MILFVKSETKKSKGETKEKKKKVGQAIRQIRPSPLSPPSPSSLLLPPLDIPSTSEAKITRFRVFDVFAFLTELRTDGWTDVQTDVRMDGQTLL